MLIVWGAVVNPFRRWHNLLGVISGPPTFRDAWERASPVGGALNRGGGGSLCVFGGVEHGGGGDEGVEAVLSGGRGAGMDWGGAAVCTVCVTLEVLSVVSITGPVWDGVALVGEGSEVHVSKGGPGTMEGGCSRGVGCGRVVRIADVLWGRASGCRGALRGEPHKGDTLASWLMGAVLRTCGM